MHENKMLKKMLGHNQDEVIEQIGMLGLDEGDEKCMQNFSGEDSF
jgi:hypothetical protein